jgi:hypothetical protein
MRTGQLEMALGMDAAIDRASDWAAAADRWIYSRAAGTRITADTLREAVGDPPGHGDSAGGVFRRARRSGLLRAIGYEPSSRPERHAAVNRVWIRT